MEILLLTISDRASTGIYEDTSGPQLRKILNNAFETAIIHGKIVPDEASIILRAFEEHNLCDFIITTGGTGISPKDVTPDVTSSYCDKLIPGIAEMFRAESYRQTPNAVFSRGVAGIKDSTVIINLPGSFKGATFCLELVVPLLNHALKMIKGEGH